MNFIKLIFAEIKKIFLKPTILVLIGLLVAVLCINGFAYNPKTASSPIVSISGSSVEEIRNSFYGSTGTYIKSTYDKKFNNEDNGTYAYVLTAKADNSTIKINIISKLDRFIELQNNFDANIQANSTVEILYNNVLDIKSYTQQFTTELSSLLTKNVASVIIKNSEYTKVSELLNSYSKLFSSISPASYMQEYTLLNDRIKSYNYISKINDNLSNNLKVVSINADALAFINDIYSKASSRLETQNEIILNYENSELSLVIANFKKEITKYIQIIEQSNTIISSVYKKNIASDPSKYYNYTSFNSYENNYQITESVYLFDNEIYSFEVSKPFNSETTSNSVTNAYDFMYSSMKILSFVIIVFSIIVATSSISNEISSGTIKLLLIRPYSRNKILLAKIISSIIISILFLFVSSLFAFIIGGILFGFSAAPMLVVLNAGVAFTIHPFSLMLIYLACEILKCIIYILFSYFISVIVKNSIFSVVISLCFFFIGIICNLFISFNPWAMALPYANFDLFNYFLPVMSASQIGNIFTGNYLLVNIFISIFYIVAFGCGITIPSFILFKKYDV